MHRHWGDLQIERKRVLLLSDLQLVLAVRMFLLNCVILESCKHQIAVVFDFLCVKIYF